MGKIVINGKTVKKWVIDGKTVKSLTIGGKTVSFFSTPTHTIPWYDAIDRLSTSNGIEISPPTTKGNLFIGDLTLKSTEPQWGGSGATYTEKELNDFLTNPNSLTGSPVTQDWRISAGAYPANLRGKLYMEFKNAEVGEGRSITRLYVKLEDGTYSSWANTKLIYNFMFGFVMTGDGNTYSGSFSTSTLERAFLNAKTSVSNSQFINENALTSIVMPTVTSIDAYAFYISPLSAIYLPKVTHIGNSAFSAVQNLKGTIVTLNYRFYSKTERDRIFGAGKWNNIKFRWLNDDGSVYTPPLSTNSFTGSFSTTAKRDAFLAITDTVAADQFNNEPGLTSITLPDVITIGNNAFRNSPLTSVDIPKVQNIGSYAFYLSKLTSLDLPEVISVGSSAFYSSPLTNIKIPKARSVGTYAFRNTINAFTTEVQVYRELYRSSAVGLGPLSKITFRWSNEDGSSRENTSFTGTFSELSQQTYFMRLGYVIPDYQFKNESNLTGIRIPYVETIGRNAFQRAPLTEIYAPRLKNYQYGCFESAINAPTTIVTLPSKFNNVTFKNKVFKSYYGGGDGWDRMTFKWVD